MLKGYTKAETSWMLYDWANSAFATIIAAIILPIFFKEIAHQNGVSDVDATAFWGYATSCGTLICAVLAPFMGTLGDFKGMKKKLFTAFMLLGVISSALLAFTGNWKALLALYVLGTLGFNGSCVYYDSFLLDVTTEDRMDRVSTLGYGLGYIGGSTIPLVLSLLLIQFGDAIGIGTMLATRISFLLTAGWWLAFTLPMLRHVQQKHGIDPERIIVLHTLRNVKNTCGMIVKNRSVVAFIIAYFFYIDGVGIVTYVVVCFVAFKLSTLRDFLILAVLVGTAQGGIQALSRSFFGKLVPEESASEYFGFFDVFGKFSAVIGPALFGLVAQATGVSRYGILPVLSMFVIGGVIMAFVVPKKIERIH